MYAWYIDAMCNITDLSGKRSGRLLVVDRATNGKNSQPRWNCICDCGTKRIVYGAPLRAGMNPEKYAKTINASLSCGCLQKEIARRHIVKASTTHGESKTSRYQMFISAKIRAKKHDVPFELDLSEFPDIPEECPILGIPLRVNSKNGPHSSSPTLDRIVPSLGYVIGNIQIISHRANTIKSDATYAEIMAVAKYVLDNSAVTH